MLVVQGRGGSEKNQTAGEERLRRAAEKVQINCLVVFSFLLYVQCLWAMECVTRAMELGGYREKCSEQSSPQCLAIDLKK